LCGAGCQALPAEEVIEGTGYISKRLRAEALVGSGRCHCFGAKHNELAAEVGGPQALSACVCVVCVCVCVCARARACARAGKAAAA
jgi:hypothetical protein